MLTKEQTRFLNKYVWWGKWRFNSKSGLVDIKGDFRLRGGNWKTLPGISFGYVSGNFDCSNNKLTSLEGAPQKVGGDFFCYNNNLISLEGAPKSVGGIFNCTENKLISLKGIPLDVGSWFFSDFLSTPKGFRFNQKGLMDIYLGKYSRFSFMKTKSLIKPLLKKETLDKYIFIDF